MSSLTFDDGGARSRLMMIDTIVETPDPRTRYGVSLPARQDAPTRYAVYAHAPYDPTWRLLGIEPTQAAAERFADGLLQSEHVARAGYDREAAAAVAWDEAIVVPYDENEDVPDPLPDDRVATISARLIRANYVSVV
jgi:hypothetical protein